MMEAEANPVKAIFGRLEKLENLARPVVNREGHRLVERVLERCRKRLGADDVELRARIAAAQSYGSRSISDILRHTLPA